MAAIAALAAALLPTVLSSGPGLGLATSLASRFLPGIVQIQEADLGWTKPVKFSGVTLQAPTTLGGETLATVASVSTNARLWDIARGRAFDAFAVSPWIDCTLSAAGQLKWVQLLDYEAGKATASSGGSAGQADQAAAVKDVALVTETADVPFTAEGRLLTASLYISDGLLKVPLEVKEILGKDLHLVAVMGSGNLEDSAEEYSIRADWASSAAQSQQDGSSPPDAATRDLDPVAFAVRSEHLDFEAAGWRRPDGQLQLHRPATAELQFTPALAKYGLTRVSPLLSGVLAVEEGVVKLSLTTPGMLWPAERYHMRIDPLRVAVNRQDFLAKAIEFLRLRESKEVGYKSLLQGATSALHVDFEQAGGVVSKRLDLLISPGGKAKGVHLSTWGSINPVSNSMDVILGVPPDTLAMAGLKGVPEDEMLIIPVKGSTTEPRVDWLQAYKRLAGLAASFKKEPSSLRGQILQGIAQGLDLRANAPGLASANEIPAPVEPLPWDVDGQLPRQDVRVGADTVKGTEDA